VSLHGRVALVGPVPPDLGGSTSGGVATHQAHLAAGLVAQGVEAYLLATNASRARPTTVPMMPMRGLRLADPRYLRAVGVGVLARYALHLRRPQRESRRELLGRLVWYRRFICAARPRLIHVQHPLERCSAVRAVLEIERLRLPIVVTAHSLFGEHPEPLIHQVMAPNLRAADRVIAVSPHVADQAVSLGVDAERVRVIRSGVDAERFRPGDRRQAREALAIDAYTPLVLFVGNLEPRKQLDVLLRAMVQVQRAVPDAQLAIVGSGAAAGVDDQTRRLQHLACELDLATAARFTGAVDADTLLRWYTAADVFALPSSSEAQGIVALEAMACGVPVVASAVGGLLGTIDSGHDGYLVPPGDPNALADRLVAVLTNRPAQLTLGRAARRKVEVEFSWSSRVAATIEVYREVVGCA
jgi:glycosyltransferase involved in cell wall biosynthesis